MTFRIMLRERGKPDFTIHNGPVATDEEARQMAQETVRDSGFDAFQIWSLVEQQELVPQFVKTVIPASVS